MLFFTIPGSNRLTNFQTERLINWQIFVIASISPRCTVTNRGGTDSCVFAAEKCSETSDRCIFCIHARACPASIASALGIRGNKRSEAISLAWVPLSRGLPRRCRSSQRQASLILSSSRAQRGNLLNYNQQARNCRVATASRNDQLIRVSRNWTYG